MKRNLFYYDAKSLQYKPLKNSAKRQFYFWGSTLLIGVFFAMLMVWLAYVFFRSPREMMQARELEQYKIQYTLLQNRIDNLEKVAENLQDRDDNIYRIIFESEPIPAEVREVGVGGARMYSHLEGYPSSEYLIQMSKSVDKLRNKIYVQSNSLDELFEMAKNMDKMRLSIPAIQPISDEYKRRISDFYGYRIHPIYKKRIFHSGLDFSAPSGTPIYATGDGVIVKAKKSRFGYGNKVVIKHGYGYETLYAHLNTIDVRQGQRVKRGQQIGTVGNTGLSTSPHLHYEVIKDNKKVNPIYYFFNDMSIEDYNNLLQTGAGKKGAEHIL